jgi:membrane-bound ClpP family serine protease
MAKKVKDVKQTTKAPADFALGKENYKLLAIGFVIIVIGFILLAGGGSDDPNVFSKDLFNFRRTTLSPIILFIGFGFEIYAIMKKPKED